ncbi:MAG TPA: alpha-2-macroglobulin family protein [Longimicrobium sp.]|nr:alpha-2-macroglobulin family protein [Longimicrobium sp.]
MTSPHRFAFAAAALAAAALCCARPAAAQRQVPIQPLYPQPTAVPRGTPFPADSSGLRFRLDQVVGTTGVQARPARATGRLLTAAESLRLMARLAPLRAIDAAADSFRFPAETLRPPRAGRVIAEAFPARDTGAVGRPVPSGPAAAAPLTLLRRAPEGEVDQGAEVTLTFSQPMVPLGSVGDVAAQAVPARLTPAAPGRWRWIDARTLKFEPRGRLPMATVYTVEVPAGTRGSAGAPLPEAIRWTFSTPAARALGARPQGAPTRLTPVMAVAFDQRVDAAAVLRTIRVRVNGTVFPVRLATAGEIAAEDDGLRPTLASYAAGRTVAFRTVAPLPRNARVRVSVGPGTPSAEGPRVTDTEQFWEFRTYGPLRLQDKGCSCRPGGGFYLSFSNTLDERSFNERMVTVTPALPGLRASVSGNGLYIYGDTRASTRYTVRVSPTLRDEFGQALGPIPPQNFDVGLPYANLDGPGGMLVLDPLGPPAIRLTSIGHPRFRLRIQRVEPGDWRRFERVARPERGGPAPLPGRTVADRVITVPAPLGQEHEVRVDVSPALTGGVGQAVVAVEALEGASPEEREQAVYTWVQGTRIGVTAFSDMEEMVAWATSLVDGAPVAGARVEMLGDSAAVVANGATDARGVATLALPALGGDNDLLVVRAGADVAILPKRYGDWSRRARAPAAAWYAFTDRNLYKPGETVRFKGWVRRIERTKGGGLGLPGADAGDSVGWTAFDARGNRVAQGTAALTALGGFDARFTAPEGANLGSSVIQLTLPRPRTALDGATFNLNYQVQEFRRPEYTVSADASPGPHFLGGSAEVTVRASYFAGGPLAGAPVHWNVTATPGSYTPPGWDEWTFSDEPAWWRAEYHPRGSTRTRSFDGATNAAGENVLRIAFDAADPPRPYGVRAEATVTDVNRQTWSASASLLVHPASIYVGMRLQRAWLAAGDSIDLDLVAVDLDGAAVAGRTVEVHALRRVWKQSAGVWSEVEEDAGSCTRVSEPQPVRCVFPVAVSGRYQVRAAVRDPQGRVNYSTLGLWVTGPGTMPAWMDRQDGERQVELVPDRKSYAPGDTARILVRTTFMPSVGLLTTRANGLVSTQQVRLGGGMATLRIPITEADIPGVGVQLDLVGAADGRHGEGARGVLYATGTTGLYVPPAARTLAVKPLPRDTAAVPDAETEVAVEVRDAAGRPVPNAEVALVVVDEAVLALTGYRLGDPLQAFYPAREPGVQQENLRERVVVVAPDFAPEPHMLVGRVVDARNGGYLGGAALSLDGSRDTVRTDESGRFRIGGVAAGAHTLAVAMEGYAAARVRVTVTGDQAPAPLRVSLVPVALAKMADGADFSGNALAGRVAASASAEMREAPVMQRGFQGPPSALPPPPPPPPPPAAPGGEAPGPQIAIRTNFDPLAVFAPVVRTDASGRATVPFKLPSNLTRYRVTAVAVEGGTRYGLGESAITARQPLMVRPSAPRFLNWGDRFELPVVVQNQTGAPLEVDVAARGTGVNVTETGWRVTVPAHDRVEVRLAAEADRAGTAQLQIAAAGAGLADAAEVQLPVYTPATTEAFATYGTFTGDSAVTLPLQVPADAIPSFGGLEVSASSTALHELTDALVYLVNYPYECAEQIASRMLGVTALRDVLYAFKASELPPPEELRASVDRDVRMLVALQNDDGGFGFWRRGEPSFPYVSIHAAHALQRAGEKGYAVPAEARSRALGYLRRVPGNLPSTYPPDVRRALHAYALYVRARMGDNQAEADVRRWVQATPADSVTVEEAGWLITAAGTGAAMADVRATLLRLVNNRATETPSTATFATRYTEGEYLLLHSSRRTDGVVLEALVNAQPNNPLVPKVVRGLLGHRVQGRWDNTQENAWVLIALDRYFHAFEGETPEFVARLWLGERFAGSHAFNGRQADRWQVTAPMRVLQEQRPESITVGKEGPGRLYYRAGLRYAPRDLDLLPLDAGFVVSRTYEAVDAPRDVVLGADGQWRVKAGARVRVTVTMTAPSRRLHVALADPLPAGFEPVNPELQGAQQTPPDATPGRGGEWGWWWRAYWYQHQNLRDQRAEAFTSYLPAGTYTYQYVARATTPGRFIVPPPHAEEMYSPEVFGRGKTERVTVVPAEEQ